MRHNSNDGRKSAPDLSRFPVSASVSYTIYMSRRQLSTVTKPANLPTKFGFVSHIYKKVVRF